jgi:acyl-CoA synthetase (AMP-forming)/AMP-acid ligase II
VVAAPDELRGEEVKAFVALVDGGATASVSPAQLVEHCRARLAKHKVPRYVVFRDDPFPRTPSMRVKKDALVAEGADPAVAVWDRERELGW